jgi:hypothetical protein
MKSILLSAFIISLFMAVAQSFNMAQQYRFFDINEGNEGSGPVTSDTAQIAQEQPSKSVPETSMSSAIALTHTP